jgi:cell division protein FtsA
MSSQPQLFTGIDIGTNYVRVVVSEAFEDTKQFPTIVGVGSASSKGLRHGYIINQFDVVTSLQDALATASKSAQTTIKSARVAVSGISLDEVRIQASTTLTRTGGEVTEDDIERVLHACERAATSHLTNRQILHTIPVAYHLDGSRITGRPIGMRGTKLTVEALIISCLEQHYKDLVNAVHDAGVEVEEIVAAPLAASIVNLNKKHKHTGVVLANIGAETLSIAVFDEDIPLSVKVFPMGSADITNDIALSLKISLSEAEQLKRGAVTRTSVAPRKIDDVVASRLRDMFGLIDSHLRQLGLSKLLPAGVIITGGGGSIATAEDVARASLKLPATLATLPPITKGAGIDNTWSVAYGLCAWGFESESIAPRRTSAMKGIWEQIRSLFKAFTP